MAVLRLIFPLTLPTCRIEEKSSVMKSDCLQHFRIVRFSLYNFRNHLTHSAVLLPFEDFIFKTDTPCHTNRSLGFCVVLRKPEGYLVIWFKFFYVLWKILMDSDKGELDQIMTGERVVWENMWCFYRNSGGSNPFKTLFSAPFLYSWKKIVFFNI